MDMYWLMPQDHQTTAGTRHVQPSSSSPTSSSMPVDDWAAATKDRTNGAVASQGVGAQGSPPSATTINTTPTLDLSDFTTLDDLSGPGTNSTMLSPTSFFGYNYYMPPFSTTYPAWPATSSVPLSNYSSLNGATNPTTSVPQSPAQQQQPQSSSSSSQPPLAQQQSPPSQHSQMIIDPTLSTLSMNGSGSNSLQHQFQGTNYPPPPQQTPYSFSQPLQPYTTTSYYRQPHASSTQQGTLSPQVLHSASGMHPTMFYSLPPQPPSSTSSSSSASTFSQVSTASTVTPQQQQQMLEQQARERKDRFEKAIRPLLQSSAFTGAAAVQNLVDKITDYGSHEVESAMRLEILTKMRDGAPNHYFRAWSENVGAIEITREWLKATFKDDKSQLMETIMPLLHIIDRLPLTVESLKASKLGKIVVRLVKDAPSPAIKDMASNLERRWRQMVSSANAEPKSTSENSMGEDSRSKKRKLGGEPGASFKGAAAASTSSGPSAGGNSSLPPAKKTAVGTSSSTKPVSVAVKKEGGGGTASSLSSGKASSSVAANAVKNAGTDTSFFSAPKSKAKLPTFKKAPVPPKSVASNDMDMDSGVAQPSSVDPFQEALKMMKVRRDSPAVSTPPGGTNTPPATTATRNGATGGKKKSVTWPVDTALESIRWIERAVYDDDVKDPSHVSLRDLDRGEGAALHAHLFEEAIDWSEPILLELHEDVNRPRGGLSEEKDTQEKREQTALGALYMNPSQIPDTPAEPSSTTTLPDTDDSDQGVPRMTVGEENDNLFWSMAMMEAPVGGPGGVVGNAAAILAAPPPAVAQLLETLMNPALLQQSQMQQQPGNSGDQQQQQLGFGAAGTPSLQHLIQQLQGGVGGTTAAGQYGYEDHNSGGGWGGTEYGYDESTMDHSGRQWDGGRGRGRGRGGRAGGGLGRGGRDDGGGGYRHNKRKPCSFFAQGRCKFGDQCDFAHETF